MKIDDDALTVLSTMRVEGRVAYIIEGALARPLYLATNKALEALGGKWDRRTKGHVFPDDPTALLDAAIVAGKVTTAEDMGYFPTPPEIVKMVIEVAQVRAGMKVLEPSAGGGAILRSLPEDCWAMAVEIDGTRASRLAHEAAESNRRWTVVAGDFLGMEPGEETFDAVAMNPPFSRRQDIAHVRHAFKFLRAGGRLAAIMSAGVGFRQDRLATEFRAWVADHDGEIERLPVDAFKPSGTAVRTVLVTVARR